MDRVWVLIRGEALLQFRQPVAMMLLLVLPLLMVPGGLIGANLYQQSVQSAGSDSVEVSDDDLPYPVAASPEAAAFLEGATDVVVREGTLPPDGELPKGNIVAEIELDGRELKVSYRSDNTRSRRALKRIKSFAQQRSTGDIDAALAAAGVQVVSADLLTTEAHDVATRAERGGDKLGGVLPSLLLLAMAAVGTYASLDAITGEKDRGTAETLLSTSAPRVSIIAAKAVVTIGSTIIAGLVGLAGLVLVASMGLLVLPELTGQTDPFVLTGRDLGILLLITTVLGLQIGAAVVAVAAWAPDYRTGSMLSAPVMILLLAPAALGTMPGITLTPLATLIPVANMVIACREGLAGTLSLGPAIMAVLTSFAHTALALGAAWRLLDRPDALLGSEGSSRRSLGHTGREAAWLFAGAMALLWFFGQLAQQVDLVWGMLFTQVVLMAGSALGVVWWTGLPIRRTLSMKAPRAQDMGLALMAGMALPGAGGLAAVIQDPLIPTPTFLIEQMADVLSLEGTPAYVPMLVFALLPGICEELLFRGALLGLLRDTFKPVARVVVVALMFGWIHLVLPRLFPTAMLGLLLGFATLRSGSLLPAILMHTLNNGLALWMGRIGYEPEGMAPLIGSTVVAIGAVALMGRGGTSDDVG